jgi:concentrative nucleoside transporter, CNT family
MHPSTPTGTPLTWRLAIGAGVIALAACAYIGQETLGRRGQAALGIVCFLGIGLVCSANIRAIRLRTFVTGFLLQVTLALLILKVPPVREAFHWVGEAARKFMDFAYDGAKFVFGPLVDSLALEKGLSLERGKGGVFAFIVLPTVVFVSSFFTVLYFLGILQLVVRGFAWVMRYVMGTSGAETLSVTANVFLGQTEAPLIVRPFIPRMTRSELLALMIGGMAHISGALMAVYINMGADPVAILATSVMAAPASLYVSKILVPEMGHPETLGDVKPSGDRLHANVIDAAAAGASEGMRLAINIAAMLIAFIAFIALINHLLAQLRPDLSLQMIFARLFSPVAVLMGVQGDDVPKMGELLGTKLVLNEFVAYTSLRDHFQPWMPNGMSREAYFLAAFALTGFANFASIGIQLGGIGGMAENRRGDLARLGLRALLGGFLATLINAAIAAVVTAPDEVPAGPQPPEKKSAGHFLRLGEVDGRAQGQLGGFHDRLGEGGMRVDAVGHVAGHRAHLDREDALRDHLARVHADNSHAQHALAPRIDEQLRPSFGAAQRDGAPRGHPGEFDLLVGDVLRLGVVLGQAAPGDLGVGEHHRRDGPRSELRWLAENRFDNHLGFSGRLVGQARLAADIADRQDMRGRSATLWIDFNVTALVELHPGLLQTESRAIGPPADRHEHAVVGLLGGHVLSFEGRENPLFACLDAGDLGVQVERLELLPQAILQRLDQVAVYGRQEAVGELDDGDLRTECRVDGADFQPDVAPADDQQPLGDVGEQERCGRIHHALIADGERLGQRRQRAGGDNAMLEAQVPRGAPFQAHGVGVLEDGPGAGDHLHAAAAAEQADIACQLADDLLLHVIP